MLVSHRCVSVLPLSKNQFISVSYRYAKRENAMHAHTQKNDKDRDKWHSMSLLKIFAIQWQTNLLHLETERVLILCSKRTKRLALQLKCRTQPSTAVRHKQDVILTFSNREESYTTKLLVYKCQHFTSWLAWFRD